MNDFWFYFKIGLEHILSIDALDHLLFLLVITCMYSFKNLKQVLILITAFTIGHATTLVLSTVDLIKINSDWIEFLIPLTIVITALYNIFTKPNFQKINFNYLMALVFGLIHGLGFANTLKFILADSKSFILPLLGFNVGIELAQVFVVTIILILHNFIIEISSFSGKLWQLILSSIALCWAAVICVQRFPF